jgi:hypothetical protein
MDLAVSLPIGSIDRSHPSIYAHTPKLVAVVSGCLGGVLDLGKAVARLGRARRWCKGASQMESRQYGRELSEMRVRLQAERWEAAGAVLDGACVLFRLVPTFGFGLACV